MVTEVIDVIDFFDQIDDLIEFPPDNECSDANLVTPNYCKDFPTWDEALQYYDPLFSGGSVPYEDVMPLEWLSSFVEGSFSTLDNENMNTLQNQFQTSSPISSLESNSSSSSSCRAKAVPRAPQRARSKRPRPAPASSDSNNSAESPSMKKIKTTNEDDAPALVRKCSHCGVTKTPQWRAGPTGPKTLCNACGVRFKSGRLFPEYRPAASPTFVPALHSNSHKRVIEMRGKFATEVEPIPKASLLT